MKIAPLGNAAEPNSERAHWMRALTQTARIEAEPHRLLAHVVSERASTLGDALAIRDEERDLSWRELAARTHRYGHWALAQGLRAGQRVALLMPSEADYLAIWLGITSVGGVAALINTNLRGPALKHCLEAAAPSHVIVHHTMADDLLAVTHQLASKPTCMVHGNSRADLAPILTEIASLSDEAASAPGISIADPALLIYTSGTTGLPKAAFVSHRRIMMWSHWFAGMMDLKPSDRVFNCLPLHHSVGGVAAVGAPIVGGASSVVRKRFSVSRFWDDIVANECTAVQYIGELCRYLVNAPATEAEQRHKLRLACGNGLAADIWERFETRFRIPRILEFYAATEGNFSLYNCAGKRGSIGRFPPFLTHLSNVILVRHDIATGEACRDALGRCVRCTPGEIGEALGQMRGGSGQFEGYTNADASKQKILRDVLVEGDAWVRSGDLMRQDEQGFYYFVDRIGDTFRWKGENVATTEVANAVLECPGVLEASVYGVEVPGMEGRAGMVAVVANADFDLAALGSHLDSRLPSYARPIFLRLQSALTTTATFRPLKHDLARQGFAPDTCPDPVYVQDAKRGFVPLDAAAYQLILAGQIRL